MSKLSRRPPRTPDEFINGAGEEIPKPDITPAADLRPWESPTVRADVKKVFNVRLDEPLFLKLKWLADNGPESMHQIVYEAVESVVNQRVWDKEEG